ncbi:MAG TPA: tail fiber protein [Fimbriimonadaceae bacterium]|nr:tail fiber protein [Fimbriimonadaceae bacterium]
MDPFLGEIRPVPYNFAPRGWAFCQGQIMQISQNSALFSLLGTTFGGNGTSTFALPDLRGRVPLGAGQSQDGNTYTLGEVAGVESVTLQTQTMPAHNHGTLICTGAAQSASPQDELPATSAANVYVGAAKGVFAPTAITNTGQGLAHGNIQPYTTINYIIALEGIYPQRS